MKKKKHHPSSVFNFSGELRVVVVSINPATCSQNQLDWQSNKKNLKAIKAIQKMQVYVNRAQKPYAPNNHAQSNPKDFEQFLCDSNRTKLITQDENNERDKTV